MVQGKTRYSSIQIKIKLQICSSRFSGSTYCVCFSLLLIKTDLESGVEGNELPHVDLQAL